MGLSVKEEFAKDFIEAQVFYEYQKLNTSILVDNVSSFGIKFTYGFGTNPNKVSPGQKGEP